MTRRRRQSLLRRIVMSWRLRKLPYPPEPGVVPRGYCATRGCYWIRPGKRGRPGTRCYAWCTDPNGLV